MPDSFHTHTHSLSPLIRNQCGSFPMRKEEWSIGTYFIFCNFFFSTVGLFVSKIRFFKTHFFSLLFPNSEATFVPGLFKIFDEILVNAADNKMVSPPHITHTHASHNHNHNHILFYFFFFKFRRYNRAHFLSNGFPTTGLFDIDCSVEVSTHASQVDIPLETSMF